MQRYDRLAPIVFFPNGGNIIFLVVVTLCRNSDVDAEHDKNGLAYDFYAFEEVVSVAVSLAGAITELSGGHEEVCCKEFCYKAFE